MTNPTHFDEKTLVPMKLVIPLIATMISCTWILNSRLNTIEAKLGSMWTIENQYRWADEARRMNPTIQVPYVIDVLNSTTKKK